MSWDNVWPLPRSPGELEQSVTTALCEFGVNSQTGLRFARGCSSSSSSSSGSRPRMGRELRLYAFSAETWKRSLRAADLKFAPGGNADNGAYDDHHAVLWKAVTAKQKPEEGPQAERFVYALGQKCIVSEKQSELATIDGVPFASSKARRAVATFLGQGRSLSGAALSPHAIYGWIVHGAELKALVELVDSKAWSAWTAPDRYRASAVPAFERDRASILTWLRGCETKGQDIYFADQAFWLPKTKVKRPSR